MPEKDYVHAIYVIAVILLFAPFVASILFNFAVGGMPNKQELTAGSYFTAVLFQTTAFMMLIYVAYKRFIEGYKDGRSQSIKSPE
jgi:hypothetical protein